LPFELLAFTCAAVGAGNPGLLPLATLAASFLVQTHVGTAPGVMALGFAALATALVQQRGKAEPSSSSAWRRGAAISVGVLAVLWAPVVLEQMSSPVGNLTKLVRFFGEQGERHAFGETYAAISGHFSMIAHIDASYGTHAAASDVLLGSELARGAMAAMVASLVLPFVLGRFRGDAYAVSGAVVAVIGTVVAVIASTRVVGPLFSYLFMWTTGLGTLCAALYAAEAGAWLDLAVLRLRSGRS
jgi:drug/metabolite transporter superfamily protein YnfA